MIKTQSVKEKVWDTIRSSAKNIPFEGPNGWEIRKTVDSSIVTRKLATVNLLRWTIDLFHISNMENYD